MNGKGFLIFAKTIYGHDDEAARRSAVSRSYYAIYHHVKSLVDSVVPPPPKRKQGPHEHTRYVLYLKGSKIKDIQHIGGKLEDLRDTRKEADYDLELTKFNKGTCKIQCDIAESLFKTLDEANETDLKKGFIEYAKIHGDFKG